MGGIAHEGHAIDAPSRHGHAVEERPAPPFRYGIDQGAGLFAPVAITGAKEACIAFLLPEVAFAALPGVLDDGDDVNHLARPQRIMDKMGLRPEPEIGFQDQRLARRVRSGQQRRQAVRPE